MTKKRRKSRNSSEQVRNQRAFTRLPNKKIHEEIISRVGVSRKIVHSMNLSEWWGGEERVGVSRREKESRGSFVSEREKEVSSLTCNESLLRDWWRRDARNFAGDTLLLLFLAGVVVEAGNFPWNLLPNLLPEFKPASATYRGIFGRPEV